MSAKSTRRRRTEPKPAAPLGLRLAFACILESYEKNCLSADRADVAYPAAQRIFAALNSQDSYNVIVAEIARTVPRLFEGADDPDPDVDTSFLSETAFVVGFATCWLAMTSMGGAR